MGVKLAASALALLLAVAACGGDEGSTDRVKGGGYSYAVPEDWVDRTEQSEEIPEFEVAGFRPDTVATGERHDGFTTNVNVIREPGLPEDVTARDYADLAVATLRYPASSGFPPEVIETIEKQAVRDLSETGSTELAGEQGATWEYTATGDGRALRHRQLVAVRSNVAYTLTYTAPQERFEEDMPAFEEIIESWRWD